MTLREKYQALLDDLLAERAQTPEGTWWAARLDQKIVDLRKATEERYGSGTTNNEGGSPGVQDVSGGAS